MSRCQNCDPIPQLPPDASTLVFHVPRGYLRLKWRVLAEQSALLWEEWDAGVFATTARPEQFSSIMALLEGDLTLRERGAVRCSILAAGEKLSSIAGSSVLPLTVSVFSHKSVWIADLLEHNRLPRQAGA